MSSKKGRMIGVNVTLQLLSALITTASLNKSSYLADNLPETDPTAGVGLWTVYTAQALALNIIRFIRLIDEGGLVDPYNNAIIRLGLCFNDEFDLVFKSRAC